MTKLKIKYLICITLLISLCICKISKTYAVTRALPYVNPNNGTGGTYQKPRYETNEYDVGIQRFYCTYNDNLALLRTVSVNAYDSEGRTIIPFFPISLIDFKAGTSIGTNVQETRKASWNISGRRIYEHLLTNVCQYEYKPPECPVCALLEACQQAAAALAAVQAAAQSGNPGAAGAVAAAAAAALGNIGADISQCTPNLAEECYECQHQCDDNNETKYLTAYGPYGGYTKISDGCTPSSGPTMAFKIQDQDIESVWSECCPRTIDKCHGEGGIIGKGEPSLFPFRLDGDGSQGSDIVKMCTNLAAADTSDKRAIPFIATPTIEIQIFEPNEYNKKDEDDVEKIELKTFSGYKVLLDKNLNSEDKLRQTKNIIHYINTFDNNYKSADVSYFLEDFYSYENLHIKEIDDPEQLKTNLPEVDYVPKGQDEYHVSYEYSPDKVCIDVRTSDVYYDTTDTKNGHAEPPNKECSNLQTSNSKKDDVKEVPNKITQDEYLNQKEVEYWHYFIPLDTKTTSAEGEDIGFFISVTDKKNQPMEWDYCISILNYLKDNQSMGLVDYKDILLPIKGGVTVGFSGDYETDYKLFSEGNYGCLFSLKVKFNIKQKFYGEATDNGKLKIKGYGFYYKPINVNDPFPNELASDSLWKNLYSSLNNRVTVKDENGNETTLNLIDAFSNITYTTKDVSLDQSLINDLRNDTINGEKYTSFKEVYIENGQSPFVEKYNLRRNVDLSALYKLGCGPDNLNWEGCS